MLESKYAPRRQHQNWCSSILWRHGLLSSVTGMLPLEVKGGQVVASHKNHSSRHGQSLEVHVKPIKVWSTKPMCMYILPSLNLDVISTPTHTFLLRGRENSIFTEQVHAKKMKRLGTSTPTARCSEEDMISQKRESTVTDSCPSKEA